MRVLIADDMNSMRSMLAKVIKSMGFDVIVAADGDEAVKALQEKDIDIAIIDWEMPSLNGIEVIEWLRSSPRTVYTHVIMITGSDADDRLITALNGGADDFISKPIKPPVLMARIRAGARIVAMRHEIMALASTDMLTGAVSRRAFFERAEQELSAARRNGRPVSILVADLDHFKKVNDTYGHKGGDAALKAFAAVCAEVLRPHDTLGRIGGEEFSILLPETTLVEALSIGERLRAAVENHPIPVGNTVIRITTSLGVAEVDACAQSIEPALSAGDRALYRAKEKGRNQVMAALQ